MNYLALSNLHFTEIIHSTFNIEATNESMKNAKSMPNGQCSMPNDSEGAQRG